MLRHRLTFTAVVVASVLFVAACSGGGDDDSAQVDETPAAAYEGDFDTAQALMSGLLTADDIPEEYELVTSQYAPDGGLCGVYLKEEFPPVAEVQAVYVGPQDESIGQYIVLLEGLDQAVGYVARASEALALCNAPSDLPAVEGTPPVERQVVPLTVTPVGDETLAYSVTIGVEGDVEEFQWAFVRSADKVMFLSADPDRYPDGASFGQLVATAAERLQGAEA